MRKIAWIIAAALGLGLAGCGGGGGGNSNSSPPAAASQPASSTPGSGSTTNVPSNVLAADATAVPTAAGPTNTVAVSVSSTGIRNQPMVSVTICTNGSNAASNCSTIPNVLVDTGSYGLRLFRSAIPNSTFTTLTGQTDAATHLPLAECALFGSGYAWGTVHLADVQLGGEVAQNVPVHVMADPALTTAAPSDCETGKVLSAPTSLGANGILGIGVRAQDCGSSCTTTPQAGYYYTNAGNVTTALLSAQVTNPVSLFAQDNNGLILEMAQVSDSGSPTGQGTLVFGIDTQSNNTLAGTSATLIKTDAYGDFTSTYNNATLPNTFFDSGSTALFFADSTITHDLPSGYYIPATTVGRTSTLAATSPASVTLGFNIANAATLSAAGLNAYNNLGLYMNVSGQFDFGIPFFYGRHVYYGIGGKTSPAGLTGPYVAYVSS